MSTSKKTVTSSYGEMEIHVPRDREASVEPEVLKKYQKDISQIACILLYS